MSSMVGLLMMLKEPPVAQEQLGQSMMTVSPCCLLPLSVKDLM